ncbi:Sodium- and chloride-dependent glycine transporter 2 [Papilio xuthus]|uniref:Transporter n=1 Tax=Papilio xuthus TaxID=66420 RepID=A0A194QD56_PAPXU|nr:Sodium- and chloride-dependent glycine transporter 2 [Papilio xuthus]
MAGGDYTMNPSEANGKVPAQVNTSTGTPEKAAWGRPLEFILACLGYAVGLGNVWRFPYLAYRNGGGAFLIPFFLMMMLIGLPLFFLELYIGQYTSLGPLKAFEAIAPFFSGLGYCTLVVISLISVYYMIIVAWTLFYTIVSIAGNLDWGSCENEFNTDCYEPYDGRYCLNGTETIPWYSNVRRTIAAEEYYTQRVLGRGDATWENWGTIQWHLVGCLALAWFVAFLCVIKGVQSAGKVVYFTALFPYVMLTALLIRGVTLEGARDGIVFYLTPDWSTLLDARVWGDAASQIFYSFGVACGSLITLASYNGFYNNCHFDTIFVCFANFLTSVYAGFAIFSVLGFQAELMGVQIDDVAEQGPGLAFVAYPEALLQMPIPQFWSILFFLMLFILGLGSQFAGIEAINTAIVDQWPQFRKRYWMVTATTCFCCFILGIPMCFSGGVYLFTLLEWNTASWAILLIGLAESAAVAWSYGINRAMNDLAAMNMKLNAVLRFYWKATWAVVLPAASVAVVAFIFSDWTAPSYADYVFPLFADILGWLTAISTIILFPVGVGWALYKGYRGKELFTPTEDWKPSSRALSNPPNDISSDTNQTAYDNVAYI